MDPFDQSRCSFAVPTFQSGDEERDWVLSLSPGQRLELLHLMRLWKWGDERVNAPIDRSAIQWLSLKEFSRLKEVEDAAEERARVQGNVSARTDNAGQSKHWSDDDKEVGASNG